MPPARYTGPSMSLSNMRANGVRRLAVRMVCTSCGIIGANVRPNWIERAPQAGLTGVQWTPTEAAYSSSFPNVLPAAYSSPFEELS